VASLRLDDLTPEFVFKLADTGIEGLTLAPECGSDRMRTILNKQFTNAEILDKAAWIFENGIENLKLYYMIGLPTETDEDLEAIRDLTVQLRDLMVTHARARGRIGRIVGSVNPLVPKPMTAYQWLPIETPAVIERKVRRLRALLTGIDNAYVSIKSVRHSFYQALLSLGDRRVAPAIVEAERNGGDWRGAVEATGLDSDFYLFRDRSDDPILPWDIIDGGARSSFFRDEFHKGLREEWTLSERAELRARS
jgi:radical SAM superfamily enzyme YgiQ (UPF0313 family)